jgi:predicted MFS family arabinose efflux permease
MWGVAAALGLYIGGTLNDKLGSGAVIIPAIALTGLAFVVLSISAVFLTHAAARLPVLAAIAVWGVSHWGFYPAQQTRLIDIAGVKVAPIVMSLNASFMYIGFSIGAALGALTIARASVQDLGWVAALCELAAVLLTVAIGRYRAVTPAGPAPRTVHRGTHTSR